MCSCGDVSGTTSSDPYNLDAQLIQYQKSFFFLLSYFAFMIFNYDFTHEVHP
jgi:hypothetical protein